MDGGAIDERPFPLRRVFHQRLMPVLLAVVAAMVILGSWGGGHLVEEVYLKVAEQRAAAVAVVAGREAPQAWQALAASQPRDGAPPAWVIDALEPVIADALRGSRLQKIKVYDRFGRILYSSNHADIGAIEINDALLSVVETGTPELLFKEDDTFGPVYELYVGADNFLFELYEPVDYLDELLVETLIPAVAGPLALLVGLTALLWHTVVRAQADIDARTNTLVALRRRLERFVSSQALGAARRAGADSGTVQSRLIDVTVFHSDVVDFTGFAEDHPPAAVVAFLNRLMAIQIDVVYRHGGDVDKMIGDAVLAIFDGADRAARAVACARDVLERLAAEPDLPRQVRVGLHDGHVILGAIGPEERQDFTVIGDTVNVAARLCALAQPGEAVADTRTVARAGHPDGFSAAEEVAVKNRTEPLRIRRLRVEVQVPPL